MASIIAVVGPAPGARPAGAQAVDTATALAGLREARAACERDAGALWGRPLCGPIALVEPRSRLVLATDTVAGRAFLPYGGAWAGVLPADVGLANTSFAWGARPWAMVLLPLPGERFARVALLAHEAFHRDQPALGFTGPTPASAHLDERAGRTWLRVELRALAAALEADDAAARRHALDALAFRARRHAAFPGADTLEAALETHEGLAEYTGVALAMRHTGEGAARVAARVRAFETTPSYARSFAYATGPALGLLLDRWDPAWRADAARERDPAARLARALGAPAALAREADRRARAYGHAAVAAEEGARDAERRRRLAALRARFVEGPTLVLTQRNLGTSFDPTTLVPLGDAGTVYPTGTFTAEWGKLTVEEGGALVAPDFGRVTVRAPSAALAGTPLRGDGWTLELASGWAVVPVAARAGSYEVRRGAGR